MVKRAAVAIAVALAFAAVSGEARAQELQRLTVQSFDLSSDTTAPKVGVPFHLILRLRVRERVSQIANLDLPILAQLELLGDERETTAGPSGTQYRETIGVVAHDAGTISIAPATLQAVDSRDGKAKEWYTNGLTLDVGGGTPRIVRIGARLWPWVLALVVFAAIVVSIVRLIRLRPTRPPAPPPPAPPPPPAAPMVRSRREHAQDALTVLRAERSRAAAVAVRGAIWRMVGASEGETLGDVLRRADSRDVVLLRLLLALERSAFTYEADLRAAIEDTCAALQAYVDEAA